MARLPTALDLSGPENMRSGRVIASYDTSAIGRGLADGGNSISDVAGKLKDQENVIGATRATAAFDTGLIDINNQAATDGDYTTLPDRVKKKTQDLLNSSAALIVDPRMREKWMIQAGVTAAQAVDGVHDKTVTLAQEQGRVGLAQALQSQANILGNPDLDINTRNKARAEAAASINYARDSGLLTPAQAQTWQDQYVKNPTVVRIGLQAGKTPEQFKETVTAADIPAEGVALLDTIAGTESAGSYNVINGGAHFGSYADHPKAGQRGSSGIAAGRYQFLPSTWERAKAATGVPDFSPESQDKAAWWLAQNDYKANTGRDLLTDLKSPDANVQAGIRRALSSTWEGLKSLGDGQFANKVAAGPVQRPDGWNELTPEQQYQAAKIANTEQNRRDTETRGNIQIVEANAPTAIMNTGTYDGGSIPNAQQYMDAYGPQEGASRYNNFMAQMDTAKTAHDMQTMPASQIAATVEQARPTSSGNDAGIQQQRYQTLSQAADTVMKARAADPVSYTRQAYPAVDAAWKGATDQPSMQAALTKTAEAQKSLGITEPALMPAQLVDSSVKTFNDAQKPDDVRIAAVGNIFAATTDPGQRQTLFQQLVKAGLPPETEGAIEALNRGDSGAAVRLFRAAMSDPSKLPGTNPATPAQIEPVIQSELMDDGQIGSVYYGITYGTAANIDRAARASKLLTNAVNLRMRNGESMRSAVVSAGHDLFGDVVPVITNHAQLLLPSNIDPAPTLGALSDLRPDVEAALRKKMTIPADTPTSDGTKAILKVAVDNRVQDILLFGHWRNSGDGFVFMDPYTGMAVPDERNQPIIFNIHPVVRPAPTPSLTDLGMNAGDADRLSQMRRTQGQ